jgi:hypothetical protein
MAESPRKSSYLFADFYAEGTLVTKTINPKLMGKPAMLGEISVAIETSRFNNGREWFRNTGPEMGLFVIQGLKHVYEKIVIPGEDHARLDMKDTVYAYGQFTHINPTGYSTEDLATGMKYDEETDSVGYKAAVLTVQNYDHHEPVLPISIQKLNTLPKLD